jgi:hypothetical protein
LDRGLYPAVEQALRALGLEVHAVGQGRGAPVENSSDDANCRWCKEHGGAVLITTDRGKKDREILTAIVVHQVHAIFVYKDLRNGAPHHLARAILRAEQEIDRWVAGRKLLRHRLTPNGGLRKR